MYSKCECKIKSPSFIEMQLQQLFHASTCVVSEHGLLPKSSRLASNILPLLKEWKPTMLPAGISQTWKGGWYEGRSMQEGAGWGVTWLKCRRTAKCKHVMNMETANSNIPGKWHLTPCPSGDNVLSRKTFGGISRVGRLVCCYGPVSRNVYTAPKGVKCWKL